MASIWLTAKRDLRGSLLTQAVTAAMQCPDLRLLPVGAPIGIGEEVY